MAIASPQWIAADQIPRKENSRCKSRCQFLHTFEVVPSQLLSNDFGLPRGTNPLGTAPLGATVTAIPLGCVQALTSMGFTVTAAIPGS